ncbi:MAG TPA: hypothetical protein PLV68_13690 [Ilumatobacteraceae bacterium]|nr:hypothetical protein [Ilumatobacteraceae bacterium]
MTPGPPTKIHVLYTGLNKAMIVLGACRANSWIEVDDDTVTVRMAWWFRARFASASLIGAAPDARRVLCRGVHGWAGRWLVNGSSKNIVRVDVEPPARAYVLGVPVRLRCLRISVEDPQALIAAVEAIAPHSARWRAATPHG